MFLPTVVHLQPTCSILRYYVSTFLCTLVSSNLIYLALSAKRFSVLKLKYAHNLLVFSCRHFSVHELSTVSVLSFSLPHNVRTMLVLPSQCFSVRLHAHIRLTLDMINETEKRGVNNIVPLKLPWTHEYFVRIFNLIHVRIFNRWKEYGQHSSSSLSRLPRGKFTVLNSAKNYA